MASNLSYGLKPLIQKKSSSNKQINDINIKAIQSNLIETIITHDASPAYGVKGKTSILVG